MKTRDLGRVIEQSPEDFAERLRRMDGAPLVGLGHVRRHDSFAGRRAVLTLNEPAEKQLGYPARSKNPKIAERQRRRSLAARLEVQQLATALDARVEIRTRRGKLVETEWSQREVEKVGDMLIQSLMRSAESVLGHIFGAHKRAA